MVSRSARCGWCDEMMDGNSYEIVEKWEEGKVSYIEYYCHNADWVISGGTCWEKRAVEDMEPGWAELLDWGFECAGCEPTEEGECTCTNESFFRPLETTKEDNGNIDSTAD